MPLQLDETGIVSYRGELVGEHRLENGRHVVRLSLQYEAGDNDWIVPLSWFAHGLSLLDENKPARALLTVETAENSIAEEFEVARFLIEKQVKRAGYIWNFHKTDVDPWPSPLHGHDYEKNLKLDAVTGNIYDIGTRLRCKTLKSKDLKHVQSILRASRDFKDAVSSLIDAAS